MADLKDSFPATEILHALSGVVQREFGLDVKALNLFTVFAISYANEGYSNSHLETHTDDSLLTLNMCLHSESTGAAVRFEGMPPDCGAIDGTGDSTVAGDRMGGIDVDIPARWILLHWGQHTHQTLPIESGERWSVIMWFKGPLSETTI